MTVRALLTIILCAFAASLATAQAPVYHAETHLVTFSFSVYDPSGNLVSSLTQNDFNVIEDGVPQQIRFFSRESNLPLTLGLLIDASPSQNKFIHRHLRDVQVFLASVLQPQDRVFAMGFGDHLRIASDFNDDPAAVIEGIRRYYKDYSAFPEIDPDETRDGGTALDDAVYASVTEKLANVASRRKAIVLFTDGEENSSAHDEMDAISAAQNADVLVYAIRYSSTGKPTAGMRHGMALLQHMAGQTGGSEFDALHTNLSQDFAQIGAELRSLYSISYYSTNPRSGNTFHRVVIETRSRGMTVHARSGYYER